jgi:serine protease SohB
VVDFEGDMQASAVTQLREEITVIVSLATKQDSVLLRLESSGGLVHSYGLAASQLMRLLDKEIPLTIAVDKVAASGGYMMACIANKIIAAPFALLGSIGVIAQIPNFHRLLKKNDIDVDVLTAGEYKRTLTIFGENTEKGRNKAIEELEDVHALFKDFVSDHRPQLDMNIVATGEAWYGKRALEKKLVDELKTSDTYIYEKCQDCDVYHIAYVVHKSKMDKLVERIAVAISRSLENLFVPFK